MKTPSPLRPSFFLSCLTAALLAVSPLAAQVHPDAKWEEFFPKPSQRTLEQENSKEHSKYTNIDGVEEFRLWLNPAKDANGKKVRQRCEIRIDGYDYSTGWGQFEGEFFLERFDGTHPDDDICIAQVWLSMMTSVAGIEGGSMRQHSPFFPQAVNKKLIGRWVKLNIVHHADSKTGEVWLDGERGWQGPAKAAYDEKTGKLRGYRFKYGLYNQAENNGVIRWKNVRFFRRGPGPLTGPN